MVRASEKFAGTSFIELDTSHIIKPLQMLCIVTLPIFSRSQFMKNRIQFYIWKTVRASENVHVRLLYRLKLATEWR